MTRPHSALALGTLLWGIPISSSEANTNPAYEAVVRKRGNTRSNTPCRGLDGRIRGGMDDQIKRRAGK
jgi:hypothetical protein